jgi:hypothetical protein
MILPEAQSARLICRHGKSNPPISAAANQRDGQITSDYPKSCQAPFAKIFLFSPDPNQMHIQGVPCPQEGRFAIVTDVGCGMRWTRRRQASNSKPDE